MPFKRATAPAMAPDPRTLDADLAGIGIVLTARPNVAANIEDTLLFAAREGMGGDLRVLALMVTWLGVHGTRVNADRLTKLVRGESPRVRAFWSAAARWLGHDRRFARIAKLYRGPRVDVLATGSAFQLQRHGEDLRFDATPLRVPANLLRDRPSDVLTPEDLVARHPAYRWRVIIGPTYRADMWAQLEARPELTAAELARATYGSFASAWQVKKDFGVLHGVAR